MELPAYIQTALQILDEHGAEGYAVGGCVRDALLGMTPHDYDLAVNVPPERTKACFAGFKTVDTGLKHGTVTVVIDRHNVEITSFRTDGDYTDLRRPQTVSFTPSLAEDLSRRDFTVNAMAYSPKTGLTDLFGGQRDLQDRVLRCVGDPDRRFNEDALRILRALRFAAVLGFTIENATARAAVKNAANLRRISAERVFAELKALLRGAWAADVLAAYPEIIKESVPALKDVTPAQYAAAAKTAGAMGDETAGFAALLLPLGEAAAGQACRELKTDNRFRADVCFLVQNQNTAFDRPGDARRFYGTHGERRCRMLIAFRAAYGLQSPLLTAVCETPDAYPTKLRELAVDGADLSALGLRGRAIGRALNGLLRKAAAGDLPNERNALLEAAAAYITNETQPERKM